MSEPEEEWRDIPGYEGFYQVSDLGRVKSLERTIVCIDGRVIKYKDRIMSTSLTEKGYEQLFLNMNGVSITKRVHRLVLMAFVPNPENKREANHKNNIRTDNRLKNLEWSTRSENVKQSYRSGSRSNKGELHPKSILTETQVLEIRSIKGIRRADIAEMFSVSKSTIDAIFTRRNWSHI